MKEMKVILVDDKDKKIGTEDKLKAHKKGSLHRAFSVFVLNDKKELLLQKRASGKYHSPGLWSNTCCSHPEKDGIKEEAEKRLRQEMGFACTLEEKFSFIYRAEFDNGLIEHEFDHVFFGKYNKDPEPDPEEVSEWKWLSLSSIKKDIDKHPEKYTPWLKILSGRIGQYID